MAEKTMRVDYEAEIYRVYYRKFGVISHWDSIEFNSLQSVVEVMRVLEKIGLETYAEKAERIKSIYED